MYHFITDKEFISKMKQTCGNMMQELCSHLTTYGISSIFHLVGSGAKNLIMQNEDLPVDLDYNLEITKVNDDIDINDGKTIKESCKKAFNEVLKENGWGDCQDSTSSLTTELRHFTKGNDIEFGIDVCITIPCEDYWKRLIHEKTGFISSDKWYWVEAPHSKNLKEKSKAIKKADLWNDLREEYKRLKNMYIVRNDYNHPSFICYIEAVNNIFNKIK